MFANPVAVPADTTPDVAPTVTILTGLVFHVPLPVPVSVVDVLVHNPVAPIIVGFAFTVIVFVAMQVPKEYVISDSPADTPDNEPVEPTIVTPTLAVLHVPPADVSVAVIVAPMQTFDVPPIAPGVGFTVTTVTAEQPVVAMV